MRGILLGGLLGGCRVVRRLALLRVLRVHSWCWGGGEGEELFVSIPGVPEGMREKRA